SLGKTPNTTVASVLMQSGENITLNCTFKEKYDDNTCIWYKQKLNQEPQQVGEVLKNKQAIPSSPFSNSTFKIIWDDTTNSLTILNLSEDYKATYFCAVTDGTMIHFSSTTFVNVTVKMAKEHKEATFRGNKNQRTTHRGEGNSLGLMTAMFTKHCCSFPQSHDAEELNYAAIHFNERKAKRGQEKRGQPEDSMYSEVKRSGLTDYHLDY
uniref:Ig-like domain-containing protein n=1 Tax=Electrophorus electricus TaxID=8005 RepID=A0AAY5F0Y3_ELEEL